MDAYKPHHDDKVWSLCWDRGYVLILIGGGCSGALQVNDTHLHMPLSKCYIQAEMMLMLALMDMRPHSLPTMKPEDCLRLLADVYHNNPMHAGAAAGFKHNFITNRLDGSEDHRGSAPLRRFWMQLQLPALREQAIGDLKRRCADGSFTWTKAGVKDLIVPFEKTGFLDVLVPTCNMLLFCQYVVRALGLDVRAAGHRSHGAYTIAPQAQ
jgi:hypothetical protein